MKFLTSSTIYLQGLLLNKRIINREFRKGGAG